MPPIDLSALNAISLARWLFDRHISPDDSHPDATVTAPRAFIQTLTTLLQDFHLLAKPYSREQIDQGLWTLWSNASLDAAQYLTAEEIPMPERLRLVAAMVLPFADVAAHLTQPYVENACYMWFDLVCDSFWNRAAPRSAAFRMPDSPEDVAALVAHLEQLANTDPAADWDSLTPDQQAQATQRSLDARTQEASRHFAAPLSPDHRAIHDALFHTLSCILQLDHVPTQSAALHGLGHLHHPSVAPLVQSYIDNHAHRWPRDSLPFLESCRDGTVL